MSPTFIAVVAGLAVVIAALFVLMFVMIRRSGSNRNQNNRKNRRKDRSALLKEASRALSQNPKDHEALQTIAQVHYDEKDWEKAMRTYAMLVELSATNSEVNEYDATLKYALSALQLGKHQDAYKSLVVARSLNPEGFELNYNLGYLEYKRKNYEKAVNLLRAAREEYPDHQQTLKYLGLALYRIRHCKEALEALRRVVEAQPDDKESLYAMAQTYYELGQNEQAVRIFTHLRPDPDFGPRAALMSGSIHYKGRRFENAQLDFEIGLRHENIHPEVELELKYRLAITHVNRRNVGAALPLLEDIYRINPDYKDVSDQIKRNRELHSNERLQTFLIAPSSEFVSLCRKVATSFFPDSRTKITDVSVQKNDYADILCEVETPQWFDVILFRFIRTTGSVGELMLRDFHGRIKELKAGRGFCITAGEFSESAVSFVEARLIDLVDKQQLPRILNKA
ncbi:MAG: tetratricopeptide repeat protein [Spirochaetota bacterium]